MRERLHRLFRPPEGFALLRGLGMTYSVNQRTLEAARSCLCGRDLARLAAFERGELFRLYFQQGEYVPRSPSDPAPNCLIPVSPERGCLHAKLYVLRFGQTGTDRERFRILITSANLTNSDELNIFASFDSMEEGTTDLGRDAAALFRLLPGLEAPGDPFVRLLEELETAKFSGGARIFLPRDPAFREAFREDRGSRELLVISPFLSDSLLKKVRPDWLASRQETLDQANWSALGWKPKKCYVLCPQEEPGEGEALPQALHAKAYLLRNPGDPAGKTVVYLGSANATVSAFRENLEALARLETDADPEALLENFQPYEPAAGEPDPEAQKMQAFEKLCREIVRSFRSERNSDSYRVIVQPGLTVRLDGLPPEPGRWSWPRTRKAKHAVTLEITDGAHEKRVPLLADGEALPCDQAKLSLEALAACFRSAPPGEDGQTGENRDEKRCGRGSVKEEYMTLSDWILRIRDPETASRVLDLAGTAPGEEAAFWEAVRRGILAAYPEAEGGRGYGGA